MALRSLVRFLLLTPIQVTIFLLISLPLAFLAATTTFFSVIFLSSRLLLVYVDLILNVLFTPAPASAPTPVATHAHSLGGVLRARVSPPLYIPRSPPRGGGASGASSSAGSGSSAGNAAYRSSNSYTAPSSPNISRKRLAHGGNALQMSLVNPPADAGGKNGAKSSPSTPSAAAGAGSGAVLSPHEQDGWRKSWRRGVVRVSDAEVFGDYFSGGG